LCGVTEQAFFDLALVHEVINNGNIKRERE
jgi:hypothetical protein